MFKILWALMHTDLKLLLAQLKDKAIDALIWGGITLIVMAHVMPALGLKGFGLFQAATILVGVVGFEIYHQLFLLVMNIEHRKHLFYLFTLPVPISLVFAQKVLFYTINGLILSVLMVPLCKIILWNQMDLTTIAWGQLFIALIVTCFFFSCFLLLLVSRAQKTEQVEHLFMRLMFPLWFLGGFQFAWKTIYDLNPYVGYLGLLSPHTYAHEAARVAVLGQQGFLPFWICITVLMVGSVVFGTIGYHGIKRNLDLV